MEGHGLVQAFPLVEADRWLAELVFLLYVSAVPTTGFHSDLRIITGNFSCLMITAEAGKIVVILDYRF